ncbi:unnamed protein product, partial [Symbiodinium sp. KB8]
MCKGGLPLPHTDSFSTQTPSKYMYFSCLPSLICASTRFLPPPPPKPANVDWGSAEFVIQLGAKMATASRGQKRQRELVEPESAEYNPTHLHRCVGYTGKGASELDDAMRSAFSWVK